MNQKDEASLASLGSRVIQNVEVLFLSVSRVILSYLGVTLMAFVVHLGVILGWGGISGRFVSGLWLEITTGIEEVMEFDARIV